MPRDNDGYDDRPKRSWSEIDKMRDGKRSGSSGARGREKLESSATYSRYKSAADAFFSGSALPDALAEKVDPTGEGKARKDALKKLRDTEDVRAFYALSKEYVEKYDLPDDPYLLDRLVGHPNEGLVERALAKITELLDAGAFKVPKSLAQRLKSLEVTSDSSSVQASARALGAKLRSAPL